MTTQERITATRRYVLRWTRPGRLREMCSDIIDDMLFGECVPDETLAELDAIARGFGDPDNNEDARYARCVCDIVTDLARGIVRCSYCGGDRRGPARFDGCKSEHADASCGPGDEQATAQPREVVRETFRFTLHDAWRATAGEQVIGPCMQAERRAAELRAEGWTVTVRVRDASDKLWVLSEYEVIAERTGA